MMEVGFSEILLISVLALIVLGPEKLPKVAAEIGRWVGRARSMARQFRDQLEEEVSLEPTIHKRNSPASQPSSAAPAAAAAPVVSPTPAAEPSVAAESPAVSSTVADPASLEITPDHAELTPHAPLEYTPEDYVASHANTTAEDQPHNERLPRL